MRPLLLLLVFGCDSAPGDADDHGLAELQISGEEVVTCYYASLGFQGLAAWLTTIGLVSDTLQSGGECSTAQAEGQTTTYSGGAGCEAPSGNLYSGSLTVTEGATSVDLVAEGFSVTATESSGYATYQYFDGTFLQTADAPPFDVGVHMDTVLELDGLNGTWRTDIDVRCVSEGGQEVCAWEEGSSADVEGIGRFLIAGEQRFDPATQTESVTLTLTGERTLVITTPGAEEGCMDYTIDGAPGQICAPY